MSWWQDTYKYANLVMSLVAKTDRHETEIKELRDEVRKLSATVQDIVFELQRDRDNAEHARQLAQMERDMAGKDRELLLARLDAKLLSYERGLPLPAESKDIL